MFLPVNNHTRHSIFFTEAQLACWLWFLTAPAFHIFPYCPFPFHYSLPFTALLWPPAIVFQMNLDAFTHLCWWKSVDLAITTPGFIYIQAQEEIQSVSLYSTHLYPISLSGWAPSHTHTSLIPLGFPAVERPPIFSLMMTGSTIRRLQLEEYMRWSLTLAFSFHYNDMHEH